MSENLEIAGVRTVVEGIAKFERDIGKYNAALGKMAAATKQAAAVIRKQQRYTNALEKAAFAVAKELRKVQTSEEVVAQSAKKVVAVLKTQLQYTEALEKAAIAVAKELRKVRDSEQEIAQSSKVAAKEVRDFTAAQSEAVSVSAEGVKQTEETAAATEDASVSLKGHIETLHAQGAAVKDIAKFFGMTTAEVQAFLPVQEQTVSSVQATTQAVKDANAAWANLVKGISTAAKMQVRQEAAQRKQIETQKKQTSALMGNIKKLALYAIGIRAAYTLVSKFRRALMDGLKTLYENTEEYKRLTTAVDQFKIALALAVVPADTAADSLRMIAEAVEWFNMALIKSSAFMQATVQSSAALLYSYDSLLNALGALVMGEEVLLERFQKIVAFPMIEWVETFNKVVGQGANALDEAGDAAAGYAGQIRSMVSAMRRWEQASAAIAARAGEIEVAYEEAVGVALGDMAVSQMKVQTDLADTVTSVHQKAAKDRAKAIADSQHAIERTVRQSQDNLAKAQEQHAIQMAHQRQRYNLSMIQSERMYLYQRGQLIAEGDVLALEDLDARHELEQDAREENFAMQERQAEELFRMQMRYQEQAIREQVAALRDGLTEQLREIKAREDEEIASAKTAADEKAAQAQTEADEALAAAETAAEEQREAQEEEQQKLLESTAQTLADMVATTDLTTQQVLDAWHAVNGPDQALDQLVKQFVARDEEWTRQIGEQWGAAADTSLAAARRLTDGWATSLAAITANALAAAAAVAAIGAGGYSGAGGLGPRKRGRGWVRQYGGEDVVTTPTTMLVGEAGPERVVVQPLSSIGNMSGSFGLGWHGGPIPVQGSGLQGADTSGLGDVIAQGLLVEMRKQLLGFSGQRGY